MRRLCIGLGLAGLLTGLCGCGYTVGRPFDPAVDSVAVQTVTRGPSVFRREIELRATEAIKKRIEHDTPFALASKGRADTLLSVTLDMVTQSPLNYNPDTGVPRRQEVTFHVSMTWTDQRSGKVRAERENMLVSGSYLQHSPFEQGFFVGREEALNHLARRIVEEMEQIPWDKPAKPDEPDESTETAALPANP